ncbi:DUF3329 domain-containing protein [Elstera cyanobacteriorum]|uniref:DUF3329 domain-containing protein n=1 Tax=Elstera cyanobacteriorum TaxID=2022747 RepID=UPI0011408127|nr:DUF3329 domain-containing protein [Elstera cyanobacteriorum]
MSKPLPPWLRPFWARLLVVLICLGWMAVETLWGQPFWATLALGAAAISAWELFLKPGRRREDQDG